MIVRSFAELYSYRTRYVRLRHACHPAKTLARIGLIVISRQKPVKGERMNFTIVALKKSEYACTKIAIHAGIVLVGLCLLMCLPLFSQGNQGTIEGSVFDQSGGAIAGATVTVTDVARGVTRTLTTDTAGAYVASNVTPGTYTVRAQAAGFQSLEHSNVAVEVGQNIRVDVVLPPGAQNQTVTVTSEVPAIDTTDATLGGTVNNQEINALPLNGRNFQRLLGLRPGVVAAVGTGTGEESSNGLRGGENVTLIEGLVTMAEQSGGSVLNTSYHQGDSTSLLPVDAIQEFNVEVNPKAEYGWRDGAVQNIGVKSGTNSLHGTAYAFGRDTALDASNYFVGGRVPISLEQYGATAGGRIIQDKLFWFLGYEKLQYSVGDSATPTIPSDVAGNAASMVDACNAAKAPGAPGINPLSAKIAGINPVTCVVSPSSPSFENLFPYNPTPSSVYNPPIITTNPIHNGVAKIDYNVSAKSHISGMFFIGYANAVTQLDPNQIAPIWENQSLTKVYDEASGWVWTPNSTWVNELRGGLALLHFQAQSVDHNVDPRVPWPAGYGIPTGITNPQYFGMPKVTIQSVTGFLGQGQREGNRGPEGTGNFLDHVSYLRGKHAFKFGFEFLEGVADNDPYNYGNGSVTFKTLTTFLEGTPSKGIVLVGDPTTHGRMHSFAGFVQDDWRVSSRVTLNLGLRYEYDGRPIETNNYMGNFNPNVNPATTPAIYEAGSGSFPPLYNRDLKDFAPRFGLAWDVKGNGKTVVRLGGGIYYNPALLGELIDLNPFGANFPSIGVNNSGTAINQHTSSQFNLATNQINWNLTGPVFPANTSVTIGGVNYTGTSCTYPGEPNLPSSYTPTPCSLVAAVAPNYRVPWTAEWNLDIQHAFTNILTVEAAYVANHGREASKEDINQPPVGAGWNTSTPASAGLGGLSPAAYCLASAPSYTQCGTIGNKTQNGLVSGALATNEAATAPYGGKFPYLQNINQIGNLDYSNYNSLQVTVTQRTSHGLTFLLGYTYSHALDMLSSGTFDNGITGDINNPRFLYANSDNDSRNRFTLSTTYTIPGIKSPGQMLQGWSISPLVALYSATPWTADDLTTDFSGTGEINNASTPFQFWNYSGPRSAFSSGPSNIPCFGTMPGCTSYAAAGGIPAACLAAAKAPYANNSQLQQLAVASLTNLGCYVQGAGVLTPPAYGTNGDAGRNIFRGQPYYNVDLSIAKDWKFKERFGVQFRAEFFNLFNRADFANPVPFKTGTDPSAGGTFGCSCTTPDATGFTNSVLGSGAPRSIQLGLKLTY